MMNRATHSRLERALPIFNAKAVQHFVLYEFLVPIWQKKETIVCKSLLKGSNKENVQGGKKYTHELRPFDRENPLFRGFRGLVSVDGLHINTVRGLVDRHVGHVSCHIGGLVCVGIFRLAFFHSKRHSDVLEHC